MTDDRFWDYIAKTRTCWVWLGRTNHGGYGVATINGVLTRVHRYTWEQANGPIPEGLQIDHLCRFRTCVRPSHLRVVDARTNVLCGYAPTADNARKTHCPKGHEYTQTSRQRICLTCRSESAKLRRLAKPNPASDPARWKFRNS